MFAFGTKSKERLRTVHPDLQKVMVAALAASPIDFSISQGKRTLAEQQALYAQGRTRKELDDAGLTHIDPRPGPIVTWTMKSNHLSGLAVDVAALPHGVLSWNETFYAQIAAAVRKASIELRIPVLWGAVWDLPLARIEGDMMEAAADYKKRYLKARGKQSKTDFPHFELDSKAYPVA